MDFEMECMCLQCGISNYLSFTDITLEESVDVHSKLVKNSSCPECGGSLIVIGKAGDEPNYKAGL
jgi:hypothetical protein